LAGNRFAAKLTRQDTSLRPHTNKRPASAHPTTLRYPFPHNHTLPTQPRTHLSHPPPHNHTLRTAWKKLLFNCVPQIFSEKLPHGLTAAWHFGVWIPNLGALPITASISLTHIPSLFACFHESVSCVYVFFSTCLSICVWRAACLVFCCIFTSFFSISKNTSIWMSLYT